MADTNRCTICGALRPADAPASLCPRCQSLASEPGESASPAHSLAGTDPAGQSPRPTEATWTAAATHKTEMPATDAAAIEVTGVHTHGRR